MSPTALDTLVNAAYSVAMFVGIPWVVIWAIRRTIAVVRSRESDLDRDR